MSNDRADLEQILSRAFGRDIAFVEARAEQMTSGVAEEYWPDMAGLEYRDTVTDFEMPAGTFFDVAVVHLLTTSTIDRPRELYPQGRFEARRFRPNIIVTTASEDPGFTENDWIGRTSSSATPFAWHHRTMPPLRDDHAAAGRPIQRLRNPTDGRSAQRSKRRRLRLGDQWRDHPPRRHGRARLGWY